MSWHFYDRYFPPSKPREAKGGIKAHSQRGAFGQSWWAKRWITTLESFNVGARLDRGRSYARKGQVLSIDIGSGIVTAKVQGSTPKPYNVRIQVNTLDKEDEKKLATVISSQILFAAKLRAGEMPQDIEQAFTAAGLSLFPERSSDLETQCSCPDWSNPCKHVAAVFYLIGEEFDRDPFLLFKLRGIDRERLLALLSMAPVDHKPAASKSTSGASLPVATRRNSSRKRASKASQSAPSPQTRAAGMSSETLGGEPLSGELAVFWDGGGLPDDFLGEVQMPPVQAPTLKRLGHFPFWRGHQPLRETLEPLYGAASRRGLSLLSGDLNRENNEVQQDVQD